MTILPLRTPIFQDNDELVPWILDQVPSLKEATILAVASKIVAVSQRRTASTGLRQKIHLIKKESRTLGNVKGCWLTLKDGHLCPNAGIDESNANGKLILWPSDPYATADAIYRALRERFHLKKIGVLITDSRIFPLRVGVTGVALGYAGFRGLRDYRGQRDIFGRTLTMTQTNVADSLATAATLMMGEGNERQPLALITDAPAQFIRQVDPLELRIDPRQDLFYPLFKKQGV